MHTGVAWSTYVLCVMHEVIQSTHKIKSTIHTQGGGWGGVEGDAAANVVDMSISAE